MQNLNQGYNDANQQTDIPGSDMPTMRLRMDSDGRATENLPAVQVPQVERAAADARTTKVNAAYAKPNGMVEVTAKRFFKALYADSRNIHPSNRNPYFTLWEHDRTVWGYSFPGWKNAGEKKIYALYPASIEVTR